MATGENTRTDGGRKPRVTDDDLLAVFDDTDDPVLSTAEVADRLPIKRRGTLDRLRRLEDQGDVASKSIGGRNTVWWSVDDDDVQDDRAGEDIAATGSSTPATDAPRDQDPAPVQDQQDGDVQARIDALDLPGSGETLAARRDAIRRLYDYLQDQGTAQKSDFLDQIDADAVGYASAGSFWSNCVKGRDSLQSLPGVDAPGEGEHTWRFRGV